MLVFTEDLDDGKDVFNQHPMLAHNPKLYPEITSFIEKSPVPKMCEILLNPWVYIPGILLVLGFAGFLLFTFKCKKEEAAEPQEVEAVPAAAPEVAKEVSPSAIFPNKKTKGE